MNNNLRRVVVTGAGSVTPVGNNTEETWNSLKNGKNGIAPITFFNTENLKAKLAAEVKNFDASKYLDVNEVLRTDRFTQLALAAAYQAVDDSKKYACYMTETGTFPLEYNYYYDELSDAYGIGDHHTSNYSDATTTWTLYLSGNTMQFKEERTFKVYYTPYKKETVYWRYNLVEKGALNQQLNGGSSTGGGESSDGTPRIGFYDFTSTQSSVTVKYQIYNREEANVSSARIYYGTTTNPSSSVSATVSGVYITATISGLSRGTQYYVKCKATGSGGSTETDVTKVMTLY